MLCSRMIRPSVLICMYVSSLGNLRRILSRGAVAKVILYGSAVEELLPCCFFVQKKTFFPSLILCYQYGWK